MPLFRLTLAYDGTDFEGWQAQDGPRHARTVQGALEAALSRLSDGVRVAVVGAGRTDAGVHALGQVVSFELPRLMIPTALGRALNGLLPRDVRIVAAAEADPSFHARRSARSKLYRYEIDRAEVQVPQRMRYAAHVFGPLDEAAMGEIAALYLGQQDFVALASAGSSVRTTIRSVTRSEISFGDGRIVYEVEADGFLRKMVRSQVGGLLAVGRGQRTVAELREALAHRDRSLWPPPAPAAGLTLVRVDYV